MIPAIFRVRAAAEGSPAAAARRRAAAAIGIVSAVGAFGGFLVPRTYAWSITTHDSIVPALLGYVGLYGVMALVTYAAYLRPGSVLARAGV
jgi:NNP family nitrate/nitrite transporter-like MFS transporter